ncbi:DUF3310 domain-containing protein [Staphylococcus gallinarum]|uniref:DUF3310 domain-containing protein n=1 Tax=Staphylococcus gallinarum TaxID=1293 RepID=UPI0030BFAEA0
MTQITDLNVGDIVRVTLFDGETVNAVYEITEVFKDFQQATIYNGSNTGRLENNDTFEVIKSADEIKTQHYQSNTDDGIDLIDFWHMQMSKEEFRGAMKSQISKYAIRLGRKDEEIAELKKIEDYARRYRQKLEQAQ